VSFLPLREVLGDARPGGHVIAARGGVPLTLGRLRAETAHNAERLGRCSIRRALLVCEDSFCFVVGLLALLQIGADIVLPPNTQSGTLAGLGDAFDALVTDARRSDRPRDFVLESREGQAGPFTLDIARSRIDLFTSGSTGTMKRVEKTAALLEGEADMLERLWGGRLGAALVLGTVTHQHVFGLTFRVMWPLLAGRCFSATIHFAWETLLRELTAATAVVSSPAHLTRLAGLAAVPATLQPRMIFTAGAPLPSASAREVEAVFGCAATEIFGSTETGAFAWRSGQEEPALWQPLPGVDIACGEDGLLHVTSPFIGGAGRCELADRVVLAGDGRFRFAGRADRIVKIEGKRVDLQQLERDILALPWIDAAAVAAVPAAERLVLGAVVVLSRQGREEVSRVGKFRFERRLRRELMATQEPAALPRRWRLVDRLPMDGMGKRRAAEVLALLEAEP
jgi:acyl-coenzyme A synthetase/AMP-(fatty) acid ligase